MFPWHIKYPNVNNEILNLDWLLDQLKEIEEQIKNFFQINTIKYANPIYWNIENQYDQNTVVVDQYTGNAYLSVKPVPAGISINNEDYWCPIFNYAEQTDYVTPEQYGAKGDGIEDDTEAVRLAAESGKPILMRGLYLIKDTIDFTESVYMMDDSKIIIGVVLQYGITLLKNSQKKCRMFKIYVDAAGNALTGIGVGYLKNSEAWLTVYNSKNVGIELGYRKSGNNENIFRCSVYGLEDGTSGIGIYANNADSICTELVTCNVNTGVYVRSGELVCDTIHSWLSTAALDAYWEHSKALEVDGVFYAHVKWLYQDSVRYGVSTNRGRINIDLLEEASDVNYPAGMDPVNCYHSGTESATVIIDDVKKTVSNSYLSFVGFTNNCNYGVTNKNMQTYDGSLDVSKNSLPFSDADDAPTIGTYWVPYNMANIPVTQNGILTSELLGSEVVQTFRSVSAGTHNIYTRKRKQFNDTFDVWGKYTLVNV